MVDWRADRFALLALAFLAFGAAALPATAVAASPPASRNALSPELDFDTLEYQRGRVVLRKVSIRQGAMRVEADRAEAEGLDFNNNLWVFSDRVRVQLPEGMLQADRASVQFRAGRIASAAVTGAPATFSQQPGNPEGGARGRASQIDYDAGVGEVRLRGKAWLADERSEINSDLIIYSIPQRSFRAEGSGAADERVRGTIRPSRRPDATGGTAP